MQPPPNPELQALIDRVAEGDKDALLSLIEAVGALMHGTILRMVSDPIAAGVLLEESFAEVWANAPLYDEYAGDPWTWLMTVARGRAMDWREKRRAKGKAPPLVLGAMTPAEGSRLASMEPADVRILLEVFHDGLPGGESGAADRQRFDEALLRLADGGGA